MKMSVWDPMNKSMALAIPLLMKQRDLEQEMKFKSDYIQLQRQKLEADVIEKAKKIEREKRAATIKYTQEMMKTAYEKGDAKGVEAYGTPLMQQGLPVPAQQTEGPPTAMGQGPPLNWFAAPQKPEKQGMTEADLTQRAIGGDPLAQSILDRMAQRKLETAKAGAGSTNVNVDVGKKSMTRLGEKMSEDLVVERKDAMGAVAGLENLKQARGLLDSGMITGSGADYLVTLGNLLSSRLGYTKHEDPVANTQAFAATMGTQVGQIIKQFGAGTGLSDADREYAEKIVGGKITLNEKAIRKLFDINEKAFKNVVRNFNSKANQAMSKSGADTLPYDLRIPYNIEDEPKPEQKKSKFKIIKVE